MRSPGSSAVASRRRRQFCANSRTRLPGAFRRCYRTTSVRVRLLRHWPVRAVACLGAQGWRLEPLNANELIDELAGIAGARRVPVQSNGIESSTLVNGIEIAKAASAGDRELRRAWRSRARGGPTPLLLLADDPETAGCVRALGPTRDDGPLRTVTPEALLGVLRRLPELSNLQAVRELAEQLEHLDRAGVAGLTVKGLGTQYLYRTRLRHTAEWARLSELATGASGEWRALLTGLGYELETLKPYGYVARYGGAPVAVVHPLADAAAFSRLDAQGRPPEGVLLGECRTHGASYGLLAAGSRFRLFEARPEAGSAVARYLELDATTLAEEDRPLLALLAPAYLAEGAFEALMRQSRAFGVELRKRLDTAIRQDVLPPLGLELGRWAREQGWDLADDARRGELQAGALTFVFRALFLLYAESAGHLPMNQEAYARSSFSQVVQDALDQLGRLDPRSTQLSDRIRTLVGAMRTGNDALAVPAYNGDLFASDGFEGAEVLESVSFSDTALGSALVALGIDPDSGRGYDFSGLEIGHVGHIYEGLLSLRLSLADRRYRYDARRDRYVAAEPGEDAIEEGDLLWIADEGGRKGGGVYYTPEPLVRHLVRRGVLPAFRRHLEEVAALLRERPDEAAHRLFEFRVLDPACGSAHFLVAVVDELADEIARFLGDYPLAVVARELEDLRAGAGATYGIGIEDAQLLRRLVLRRCVYGIDLSSMGAEIAKISLWLASFVPGLSLSYLDRNVKVGNSLIGVASTEQLLDAHGGSTIPAMLVSEQMVRAAEAAEPLFGMMDRTPDEVARSERMDRDAERAVEGARVLLNLWIAGPLGLKGARDELWAAAEAIGAGRLPTMADAAAETARQNHVFHWPLEFPEVFGGSRGFDAVVGNPPWEEVTVEELAFYARYEPGLRALPEADRNRALARLKQEKPELDDRLAGERGRVAALKRFFVSDSGYLASSGDPDLYKFFCQRYRRLLAPGGLLAVVLPRSAFSVKGSADFRRWLFGQTTVRRIDFLLNNRRWMFETHPQYTVALVIAEAAPSPDKHRLEVAGVANSDAAFLDQSRAEGLVLEATALGPELEVPLLPSQSAADLLLKLRRGTPFALGGGRWACFPLRELHETDDKKLWEGATSGAPLWKGESFDQYQPHGAEERHLPITDAVQRKVLKSRAGSDSLLAKTIAPRLRVEAVTHEVVRARVAFRDVTNRTNSRTVVASLVPPDVYLVNSAPYLAFVEGGDLGRACCLGVLNSLPFDWQARRFVETHLSYFILEGMRVPKLLDDDFGAIVASAARLSAIDERFADFATATEVDVGPLDSDERDRLRAEIDSRVAHAWGLDAADLETIFADFTLEAVPVIYRQRVRDRFAELAST
jgi:hypothetical protein